MASNQYFNPELSRPQQQQEQPYYQSYNNSRPPLSSAPSYNSQAPSYHSPSSTPRPVGASPVSPFEAPFDDHVYPLTGQRAQNSQSSLGQDSRYYGQGGGGRPQDSTNAFRDDIPLQERSQSPLKPNDSTDHVYDAGESRIPSHLAAGRRKRISAFGMGLGLYDANAMKKRIPWVVYGLTLIQVCVFIAEIVKNGTYFAHEATED